MKSRKEGRKEENVGETEKEKAIPSNFLAEPERSLEGSVGTCVTNVSNDSCSSKDVGKISSSSSSLFLSRELKG